MEMGEDEKIQRKRNEYFRGERRRGQKSGDPERLLEKENVRERPKEIGELEGFKIRAREFEGGRDEK